MEQVVEVTGLDAAREVLSSAYGQLRFSNGHQRSSLTLASRTFGRIRFDRLTGHIEETRRIMGGSEAAGRRLDFLMQELNREANTLASKSQDLDTTRITVDMKVLIEQMREQVQNVE